MKRETNKESLSTRGLPARLAPLVVGLLLVALPLGSAPLEIATGLVVAVALGVMVGARRGPERDLGGAVLLITAGMLAAAWGRAEPAGPALRAALSPLWALILVMALPALPLAEADRERCARVGLGVGALVGAGALGLALGMGPAPWESPARGLFSHHLTLGYALLPPLCVALERRAWLAALGLGAGIAASWSSGPLLAVAVAVAGLALGPGRALAGGAVAALGLVYTLRADPALGERAILWTSGAALALREPLGTGAAGFREAVAPVQDALQAGYYFPLHAHDAALQRAAVAGFGAWIAWAWLLIALWRRTGAAGRAALAGLLVGGLTQDTLGDLEVVRALTAWLLILPATGTRDEA